MANVGSNRDVANSWINEQYPAMHSYNGNMSHHGKVLYSYSTPIAQFYLSQQGIIVIMTSTTYSVTTEGKHKNAAWSACMHAHVEVLHLPCISVGDETTHKLNEEFILDQYRSALRRIATKSVHHDLYEHEKDAPANALQTLRNYCAKFDRPVPATNYEADLAEAYAQRQRRLATYHDPKNVEKRLRAQAKRDLIRLVNK